MVSKFVLEGPRPLKSLKNLCFPKVFQCFLYVRVFAYMCFLAPFLSSCGSLWRPFWTPWPTIWDPWPTIWTPWPTIWIPGNPSWVSEGLLGRPSAPLWASVGRPDPPLRPFGRAIASMDAAWTSQSIILDRFWLKFEHMFDYVAMFSNFRQRAF